MKVVASKAKKKKKKKGAELSVLTARADLRRFETEKLPMKPEKTTVIHHFLLGLSTP